MNSYLVPLIIRGKIIEDADLEFGGRRNGARFSTPDASRHLDQLSLETPASMRDLYNLSFDDILDYLEALGDRLALHQNRHMQQAFELSCETSGLTEGILRHLYENIGQMFRRERVLELTEKAVGVRYLEGWVTEPMRSGVNVGIRAFGARTVHIIAGNSPVVSATTVIANATIRGDAIIKTPSNDPLTGAAIARTMAEMAPDHPLTRHMSVAYWKGGNTALEERLYQPNNIEKIVAWGGQASIEHIAKYIRPGIDLITLDPKLSSTIIGRKAFESEANMRYVAAKLARDVGTRNQEACLNARVVYIESGTDAAGLANANRLGQLVWEEIQALPPHESGPARHLNKELQDEIASLRMTSDEHKVIGGGAEGTVIVSQNDEAVDFASLLSNRTANLVPVDDLEIPIERVTAYTQTIGIYPKELKAALRDRLPLHGAQRLVTLGYATTTAQAGPHDGIELLRRMCKWITDEDYSALEDEAVAMV